MVSQWPRESEERSSPPFLSNGERGTDKNGEHSLNEMLAFPGRPPGPHRWDDFGF